MAISALKIEFIRENKGKISLREMAKILSISHGSVSHYARDKKYKHNPETKKAYYKKNKNKCSEWSKKSYLRHRDVRIAKMKEAYREKKRMSDTRSWEQRVDEGIETYQHVMRRYYSKKFWYVDYKQLMVDFENIQGLQKAA